MEKTKKEIREELKKLDKKYISTVDKNWKSVGFSKSVNCWKINLTKNDFEWDVPFLKGIDLVLNNNEDAKHIFLMYLPAEVETLVKKYVELNGFDSSYVVLDTK